MVEIGKPDNLIKKIVLILLLTVVPLGIVVRLWMVIVEYWMAILAVALTGVGLMFIYFYFKSYSVSFIKVMIKKITDKWGGLPEEFEEKVTSGIPMERVRGFLNIGIFLELVAAYMLTQFLRTR